MRYNAITIPAQKKQRPAEVRARKALNIVSTQQQVSVVKAISEELCNYAFLVEAFEYDTITGILNFDATIVGENGIPYSKVFVNRRGVGNKFTLRFSENSDLYDSEIIALREALGYDSVNPDNFNEIMAQNTRQALEIANGFIQSQGGTDIRVLAEVYPYSLYDIEYKILGGSRYLLVKHTATRSKYLSLPLNKVRFLNDFSDRAALLLVTDINGEPKLHTYTIADLNRMHCTSYIPTMRSINRLETDITIVRRT